MEMCVCIARESESEERERKRSERQGDDARRRLSTAIVIKTTCVCLEFQMPVSFARVEEAFRWTRPSPPPPSSYSPLARSRVPRSRLERGTLHVCSAARLLPTSQVVHNEAA